MAYSKLVKPESSDLLHLTVVRSERLSAHWARVTLGGGDIAKFRPMGFDQWFRLFLPVGGDAGLDRVPAKANKMFGYLKFLRIPEGERPVMRNYTVRAYRPATATAGAEIDVDFFLHGSAADGTAGPASRWAETCQPGEHVLIIDEGLTFNPQRGTERVLLAGDETALPAIASICASLPTDAVGTAIIEVPSEEDAQEFRHPSGIAVVWIVRPQDVVPGSLALETLSRTPLPGAPFHAYAAGEQALASGARKLLVGERGVDKHAVSFCGYWKSGAAAPASKSAREIAAEPSA
ncbi:MULTISPECIES: siderophore-interacting protein [unclassified Microbacterium]|uniref:siderophore-interacting protein n=1 Tax=unclassified Microbacterium TaxID=2609290 RepID=UPI000EA97B20|nr:MULTISPECIES: siderophore-interacting protein [unclassified Microbacterium]MBT2484505.1 siderophore-interacting protein [Microbacterium sp. ISL-108]RKN67409.1 siderophore-interacting protein [Microbacterium sp. CGR2]